MIGSLLWLLSHLIKQQINGATFIRDERMELLFFIINN